MSVLRVNSQLRHLQRLVPLLLLASVGLAGNNAQALDCSAQYQVQQSFANGAAWEMCFEQQAREGMVLRDVTYTSPAGDKRRVLYQANVSQIHVPYDDDGARFHDVSDFGIGGARLNDLTPADCPDGTLIQDGSKDVFCKTLVDASTLASATEVRYGEVLSLFSVSHVGAYNYIPEWRFYDDGTIEPGMGATGRLQRYTSSEDFGWRVRTGSSPVGVSHIHNYYWKLDFDLDGGDDDRFEELQFVDGAGGTRELSATRFSTETARSLNADTQRFWRVYDSGTVNGAGRPISYDILPLETGHRDIGPSFEPWTFNDIYATNYRACERFVSHNPADSGGCAANGSVTDWVNGEAIDTNDLVVWFGVTFHHTPRDEDEAFMNAHWNRFRLEPRDWLTVGSSNSSPVLAAIADRLETVGDAVAFAASATDADNDVLTYTATGLPPGIALASNGNFSGSLTAAGSYSVVVTATDPLNASSTRSFAWNVQGAGACTDCVNFVTTATESYGGQDAAANATIEDVGATLLLQDNTWRRTEQAYTITAATVLEFEFSSSAEGEIHGIGFDTDNTLSQDQIFQLYGTQGWGIQAFNDYTGGGFRTYQIPVGSYYTGSDYRMVFVNDFDAGSGNDSRFRNIRLFEPAANTAPTLAAVAAQSTVREASASLQLQGADADGDVLSYAATNLPAGLAIDAATGLISGQPTNVGVSAVQVSVSDPAGALAAQAFNWTITNPATNGAPVLGNPGAQSGNAGDTVSLQLTATDPDGDALTYSATGLPSGVALNPTSGLISGTLDAAAFGTVVVTVTDPQTLSASASFDWTVVANVALGGSATQVSTLNVGLDLSAAQANDGDTDGNFEAFTLAHTDFAAQAWWEIDLGARYELSRIEIYNRTDCCAEALQNFHVLVSDAPFVSTQLQAAQGQAGVLDIAQPAVAPVQTILPVNRTGRFVRIQLEGGDYLQLAEVELYGYPAESGSSNFAPLVDNPGNQENVLGDAVSLPVVAQDVENDVLSYSAIGLPAGLAINATTGVISGTPSTADVFNVTVEVSDGQNNTGIGFAWLIASEALPTNVAPAGSATQSSTLDIPVDLSAAKAIDGNTNGNFGAGSLSHTDFDNQPWWQVDLGARFTISRVDVFNREDCCAGALNNFYVLVSELPFGNATLAQLLADANVTALQVPGVGGRPSQVAVNATGRHVRVQLGDAEYLQLAEVAVLAVPADAGGVNFAPALTNPGNQTGNLGDAVDLVLAGSDPEGDALSFSATGLPPGLALEASTGAISGALNTGGTFNVTAALSDGNSTTQANFVWEVIDPNAPTNVALGGTATTSSTLDLGLDFSADNAIDGNRGGNFPTDSIVHTDIEGEAWWQIDLGADYALSRVTLFNREDCCAEALRNFHVFVSNVPFTATTVAGTLSQAGVTSYFTAGAAGRETTINLARSGRYVRVQLTSPEYLQLAEVEVFGLPQ